MFWYVIGFCSFVVALLSLWVNVGAFGMQEDDYEKRLGLGAKLKNKNTPDTEEKQQ